MHGWGWLPYDKSGISISNAIALIQPSRNQTRASYHQGTKTQRKMKKAFVSLFGVIIVYLAYTGKRQVTCPLQSGLSYKATKRLDRWLPFGSVKEKFSRWCHCEESFGRLRINSATLYWPPLSCPGRVRPGHGPTRTGYRTISWLNKGGDCFAKSARNDTAGQNGRVRGYSAQ